MDLSAAIGLLVAGQGNLRPTDYEEIVISTTVVTLTLAKAQAALCAEIRFELGPVRYTLHNVDPATNFGLIAFDGWREILIRGALTRFRAIRQAGTDGTVRVVYYGT